MWPHDEFPLMPVGKLTLNRNPSNYFAEVEQLAFSPAHLVPGIEPRYAMLPCLAQLGTVYGHSPKSCRVL